MPHDFRILASDPGGRYEAILSQHLQSLVCCSNAHRVSLSLHAACVVRDILSLMRLRGEAGGGRTEHTPVLVNFRMTWLLNVSAHRWQYGGPS